LTEFSSLGLAEPLLRALATEGYERPTPIQAQAIPSLLAGEDVLGIAQTGTGKTAAFVLPLLHELATDRQKVWPKNTTSLILTPTRELAAQIAENIRAYGRHLRPNTAVVVGGVKAGPQIKALARGNDIVIATPGRLEDHMRSGAIRLENVRTVVLDEADQMLDLGFAPAIRRIIGKLPKDRQTVMFSATMPKQIRTLAEEFLTRPKEISVTPAARPIERIEQRVIEVPAAEKRDKLTELLGTADIERAIVFTRTKHGADRVVKHLDRAGLRAEAIHGNKSQGQRTRALEAFKSGAAPILVATDIASRGIDVDDVSHVVNFELPNVPDAYVHRIGRTARAGKSGIAISLVDREELGLLRDIEKLIGFKLLERNDEPRPARRKPQQQRQRPQANAGGAKSGEANRPPRRRRRNRNRVKPTETKAAA